MPYTPPTFRQITLSVPSSGLPGLVLLAGSDRQIWQRAEVGGYVSNGKTLQGAMRLQRNALPPWFVWTGTLLTQSVNLYLLERFDALLQLDPTTQFTLKDEFTPVDTVKGGWHNRAIIADSTIVGATNRAFYVFNVLIVQRPIYELMGAGYHAVNLSLEELT